jgi:hypothetical protein
MWRRGGLHLLQACAALPSRSPSCPEPPARQRQESESSEFHYAQLFPTPSVITPPDFSLHARHFAQSSALVLFLYADVILDVILFPGPAHSTLLLYFNKTLFHNSHPVTSLRSFGCGGTYQCTVQAFLIT